MTILKLRTSGKVKADYTETHHRGLQSQYCCLFMVIFLTDKMKYIYLYFYKFADLGKVTQIGEGKVIPTEV
jgi:hypothetical protein